MVGWGASCAKQFYDAPIVIIWHSDADNKPYILENGHACRVYVPNELKHVPVHLQRAAALVRFQYEPPLVGQIRYAYTAHTTHTPHLLSWIVRVGDKYAHTALHSSDLRP